MGIGNITPYERREEYYATIQLGKDVRNQTKAIDNQTKAFISTQVASTNTIIASQERVTKGIDAVNYGIERVEQGMYGLQAAFEWGISEVVWQIEQNRSVLLDILKVLSAPLNTQARELRKRAERAYENGWIDDALNDFLESEQKNRYDFSLHISLGHIYLFHKHDTKKALEYYEKAIKYARPESAYHTSYALLYKALILSTNGLIQEAEQFTQEAIQLCPNFSEALYQNAQYNAQLKNISKSLTSLEKAIKLDKNYCLKADNDTMFDSIRNELNSLFERLRDEQIMICKNGLDELNSFINNINAISRKLHFSEKYFKSEIEEVTTLIKRNSYFDALDTRKKIKDSILQCKKYQADVKEYIDKRSEQTQSGIIKNSQRIREETETQRKSRETTYTVIVAILVYLVGGGGCGLILEVNPKSIVVVAPVAIILIILGWANSGNIARSLCSTHQTEINSFGTDGLNIAILNEL